MSDTTDTAATETAPAPTPQEVRASIRDRVAREMFGKDYYPSEDKPSPEPEKVEDAETGDAQPDEDVPDAAPAEEPEGEEPEGESAAEEATGEMPIDTEAELLEHFGMPLEQFRATKMSFNVDGMPTEATIGQLIDSYQLTDAARHRLDQAKSIAQKESEAWATKHQEMDKERHVLAALVAYEEQALARDIKAVDPSLRDTDPAEWSARMTEFQQRRDHLDGVKNAARAQYDANQRALAEQTQAVRDTFTAEQAQILLQKLPEWQDETKANAEKAQLQQFLLNRGFEQRELAELTDHRHLLLVRDAWLYRQSRGQVDTAKKKVAKVPRIMKPGAPKPAEQRASERLAALKAKMIKSGKLEDATAYQLAKRGVSR